MLIFIWCYRVQPNNYSMSTLHILPNFHSTTHLDNRMDPFAIAVYRFIQYMAPKGYKMIHYGSPGSAPLCEHVDIDPGSDVEVNTRAGAAIAARKKPNDLILCFYGVGNYRATLPNQDLKIIEPSIGYSVNSIFAPYRVFTSYAQQHMFYGHKDMLMNPGWFDAVIPNAFEVDEFEFSDKKEPYLLYFGRVIESKGVHLAIQAAHRTGHKLIIAGPGSIQNLGYATVPDHVEMVGLCNAAQRRTLMRNARALLGLTHYVEPFGNMVVEAHLSGTPTITTDWGGFPETNINGVTGYRCRDWWDIIQAIENIDKISSRTCRDIAISKYSSEVVHAQFDKYIQKIISSNFYEER